MADNTDNELMEQEMPEALPQIPDQTPEQELSADVPRVTGLTSAQVQTAIERGQTNVQVDKTAKSVGDIIKENIFTYFNLIFLVLTILVCISGTFRSLTFLPVVIVNILIGIIQELRAKSVLDKLSVMNRQKTSCIRDGQLCEVATEELVLGDVILLRAGDQIPADARVIDGSVNVNEALLTGESDEIVKAADAGLMSGSFVVSGECHAELTGVGDDSYINRLTLEAKEMSGSEQSEMVRAINRFVIAAGILIIPIGAFLFVQGMMNEEGFTTSVSSMVAAVIGMIPEGLYLLVSVTLAVSAMRLAGKKVMLHDMKSIETLARVDTLCVDKTGTITEPDMAVIDIVASEGLSDIGQMGNKKELLTKYVRELPDNNITMEAIRSSLEVKDENMLSQLFKGKGDKAVDTMPFSSSLKYSAVAFNEGVYVLGAPDILLGSINDIVREYASEGKRVLVFASYNGSIPRDGVDTSLTKPLLYIVLDNPIRSGAPDTFRYFAEQEVDIKVISGDNPLTVSKVAAAAGIVGAENYIDATTLSTESDFAKALRVNTVFGRVTPEQKRIIVRALQNDGHTVAMTGDGVNDILAMKDADCSVAMASGADAAVQAAQVALLDSDFSHMPQIVAEGRRVIGNIERSATLFITKNLFSLFLAIFSIVSVLTYPLDPAQISLISAFNIGIPAFFLAMEPNKKRISGHFMSKVLLAAMPAAITDFLIVAGFVLIGNVFGLESTEISVASTFLLAIVGFIILLNISAPMNVYRWVVMIVCAIGLGVCAVVLHDLFAISRISLKCGLIFILFAIATEPAMRYLTKFFRFINRKVTHSDDV